MKLNEIVSELNSHYQTYSEINIKQQATLPGLTKTDGELALQSNSPIYAKGNSTTNQLKQNHVFITGLNTCPTYCHVCQQIIPLIAYASKCQLCSFTCHSTCSTSHSVTSINGRKFNTSTALNKANGKNMSNPNDPLKYCNTSIVHMLLVGLEYNSYINKLVSFGQVGNPNLEKILSGTKSGSTILSDYAYLDNNSKWRKGSFF